MTFDAGGNLTGVFNFEPADGAVDGPYGDIVYLIEGPDQNSLLPRSRVLRYQRHLRHQQVAPNQLRPIQSSTDRRCRCQRRLPELLRSPSPSPAPVHQIPKVNHSRTPGPSATTPPRQPRIPSHTYSQPGIYTARLSVSDGVSTSQSTPITISVGNRPVATIASPLDGSFFVAGDVISYSGDATDTEDGTLPASAFTWNVDFLHEGHVHPGTPVTGVKSGSFTIPTSGHDFSGNTRYRITLTVTDSNGLTNTKSVTVWPSKVNLTFGTAPTGLTLYLDGIAKTAPFVYDTLIGFSHTIDARNTTSGGNTYNFSSWSDGGAQLHTIVVPSSAQSYTATYTVAPVPAGPITFVQVNSATPQVALSTVSASYTTAQTAGNFNVVVVGWNDTVSNITAVTDDRGNVYQLAAPATRGSGISQAIYYAKNIVAGSNAVTATFDRAASYVDLRILEYSGIDSTNPVIATASAAGSAATANSGSVTTTAAKALIFGAGTTTGSFSGPGTGFTSRIITIPDLDIAEDRIVTTVGTYSATAPQSGNHVMQVVAFRGAAQ